MDKIEKIRQEIERRLKDYWKICFHDVKAYNEDSNVRELKELLSFIHTLEESEKPMQEGLEEEINLAWEKLEKDYSPSALDKTIIIVSGLVGEKQFSNIARHFAQWGAEHKKIEPPCHTVNEWIEHIQNADQLTKDIFSKGPYDVLYDALNHPYQHCYDAIKEFGELCYQTARQDMMKGAVEHYVVGEIAGSPVGPAIVHYDDNLNIGDKVRVIILKKED